MPRKNNAPNPALTDSPSARESGAFWAKIGYNQSKSDCKSRRAGYAPVGRPERCRDKAQVGVGPQVQRAGWWKVWQKGSQLRSEPVEPAGVLQRAGCCQRRSWGMKAVGCGAGRVGVAGSGRWAGCLAVWQVVEGGGWAEVRLVSERGSEACWATVSGGSRPTSRCTRPRYRDFS